MSQDPEAANQNVKSEEPIRWLLRPPLCGLKPTRLALVQILYMIIFCAILPVFAYYGYIQKPHMYDSAILFFAGYWPEYICIPAIALLISAGVGIWRQIVFLIYPLIALLVLIIMFFGVSSVLHIALLAKDETWMEFAVYEIQSVITIVHSFYVVRVLCRVIHDFNQ